MCPTGRASMGCAYSCTCRARPLSLTGMRPSRAPRRKRDRARYFREYRRRQRGPSKVAYAPTLPNGELPGIPPPDVVTEPISPRGLAWPVPEPPGDAGGAVAEWAAATFRVPDGILAGKPFRLDEWQVRFLRDALAPGTREAGLSVARKNGKSGLVASLLLSFLVGPLHHPGWRGVVASVTGELAKELRHQVQAISETVTTPLPLDIRVSPTPGRVYGPNRSRLDFLSADKSTGHALGANLVVIDEAGLLEESKRALWSALYSCISGRNGRVVCISIQADGPMFREIRERSKELSTSRWHEYTPSDPRCRVDDRRAWQQANPGLATGIKSLEYMVDMAAKAAATPADQAFFRAHDLNLPQAPNRETVCSPEDWDECEQADLPERDGQCVVGVDLGGSASMTAAAAVWPTSGRMELWAAFPAGAPESVTEDDPDGLLRRGKIDGVGNLYCHMKERGELMVFPGRVTPIAAFLGALVDALQGEKVLMVGADRFRKAESEQVFEDAGVYWPQVWRGLGSGAVADGSHDVRAFQRAVLTRWLKCGESLLMQHAIAESSVSRDSRGNPALDKGRLRGRIDVLQAAVIAAGLAERIRSRKRSKYRSMVL